MVIKQAKFITSVADGKNFYFTEKPIIAVSGKSNVGKSSLINMLANNSKLARTSVTPGRTRLINYFDFGEFVLADLPGYGFAKVSKSEKDKWGKLMDDFLKTEDLALLITLLDIRHDPTAEDFMMLNFLYHYAIPFVSVATKSDKLSKTRVKPAAAKIASAIKVGASDVIACSSVTGAGKDAILSAIEKAISVQRERGADEDSEADGEEK